MLTKEERIVLRNYLFDKLRELKIIRIGSVDRVSINRKTSIVNQLKDNLEVQKNYLTFIQQYRSEDEAIYCLVHRDDPEEHLCPICSNVCSFYVDKKKYKYRYQKTCNNPECAVKMIHTKEAIEKFKITSLEKFGVEFPGQSEEVKAKIRKTNLEHFGVECNLQSKDTQDKIKQTLINK